MRGDRAAMQDVELVDVATGADLAPAADDPAVEAERSRRLARRRRRLRRWWPVPVGLAAALVGTQAVLAAHEQSEVAARQRVDGVLRTVGPALEATRRLPDAVAPVVFSGITAEGDLRVGPSQPDWDDPRELIAVDTQGATVWHVSLEDDAAGPAVPGLGAEYPLCAGDGDPATVVDCVVLDRSALAVAAADDGSSVAGPPEAGRLVSVDARTGERLGSRPVPPVSGWAGDTAVHALASVTDGALVVTAWEPGAALTGEPRWRTRVPLDPAGLTREALTYPPSVGVERGHVMVQGALGSWALSAADGQVESAGSQYLQPTRTGRLTAPGVPVRVLDGAGGTVATLPGPPAVLLVDDGSEPEVEVVVTDGEHGRDLVGYDVAGDRPRWSLPRPLWVDSGLVLLEGTLYGQDREAVWAVDVATGRELWRTAATVVADFGGVLTDGRYVLAVGITTEVVAAGTPVEPAAGQDARPPAASSRTLLAFDLGTGALAWATRLPDAVQGVWAWHGDLLGFGPDDVLVLN